MKNHHNQHNCPCHVPKFFILIIITIIIMIIVIIIIVIIITIIIITIIIIIMIWHDVLNIRTTWINGWRQQCCHMLPWLHNKSMPKRDKHSNVFFWHKYCLFCTFTITEKTPKKWNRYLVVTLCISNGFAFMQTQKKTPIGTQPD